MYSMRENVLGRSNSWKLNVNFPKDHKKSCHRSDAEQVIPGY